MKTKEQQVEEFKKRVRLTPKDIGLLEWDSATLDMSFVDDYPEEVRAICEAALNKALNDPDLALIDRGKGEPTFFTHQMLAIRDASFTISPEGRVTIDSHMFGEKVVNLVKKRYKTEGFTHSVIPLAEALRDK